MHSRILNEAMEAGIVVSVAAGNDGPDNDGLSGMGSSNLAITVGATDDINTIDREDDTVASYSSRGPRRDNGDSNPLNELKPEVSAPGTNIIQAEGCVTSGTCINLFGGSCRRQRLHWPRLWHILRNTSRHRHHRSDARSKSRLSPAEVKEILKLTAEREASQLTRMSTRSGTETLVGAWLTPLLQTELSFYLQGLRPYRSIDVYTGAHQRKVIDQQPPGLYEVRGEAWGQAGSVSAVEAVWRVMAMAKRCFQ